MNSNENAAPTVEIGEANFDREVLNARQPVVVELYRHVRYLSLWFHNKARTGDLVSRLIRCVGLVQGLVVPMRVKADPRGDVRADVCADVLAELAVCDEGALGSRESALPSSQAGS